jgi:type I restriction enzyme, S subunit
LNCSEWKKVKLGEVADVLSGYAFKSKDFVEQGVPVVKIKNITPPVVDISEVEYVTEEMYEDKKRYSLSYNDILISLTGSHINQMNSAVGKIGRVRIKDKKLLLNQRVGKIYVTDTEKCDCDFLFYYLSQEEIRYKLASSAGGSANQANISPVSIKNLDIFLPPLSEQREIAAILLSLDEKIELNNEMNKTLEEMAQAIFKRWFVDFEFPNENGEPYKSSGGKFVESELGMIPEGWIASNVLNHIEEFSQKNKEKKNYPVLSVTKDGVFVETNEYFQQETFEFYDKTVYSKKLAQYKLIYKNYIGYNPSRANIGSIAMLKSHEVGLISPIYKVFKLNKEISPYYFEQYMKDPEFIRLIRHYSSGTTRQNFDLNCFRFFKLVVPPMEVQKNYEKIAMIIEERIKQNTKEIELLRELRDTLLPKLMSGEIRVPNAEREVEACLQKSS